MEEIDAVRCLELALTLCAASAVAYKAAFMLAPDGGEEREYLGHCTARYALLDGLLAELQGSLGAAPLRDLLERLDADPSCYVDRDHALTAAKAHDHELGRALAGADASRCNGGCRTADVPDARPFARDPTFRRTAAGGFHSALPLHDLTAAAASAAAPY